jgi:geranylgeranyl diphosphate synthase type II
VDVVAYMAERVCLVDRELDRRLPAESDSPRTLHAAMRHLVFPGGKRLRPALAMAAAEAVGKPAEAALPMAVAVELIHTYSLIHDDLPCMDDDAERRGRPSVHMKFGEAVAVLAGDALQALAFEAVIGAGGLGEHPTAQRALAAVRELAWAAGVENLVGGQVDDLSFDRDDRDPAAVESVHRRKSAALIAASVTGGACLTGTAGSLLEDLRAFGLEVGVAFQIADDVLDDGEDDPCSLVRAIGLEPARQRAAELLGRALERIESLGDPAEPLRELARYAVWREV